MNTNDLDQISQLLDQKLAPVQKELNQHSKVLNQHSKVLSQHSKVLNQHGKILRSLKKDQNTMLRMLDREQTDQSKRLKRIEDHVGITSIAS